MTTVSRATGPHPRKGAPHMFTVPGNTLTRSAEPAVASHAPADPDQTFVAARTPAAAGATGPAAGAEARWLPAGRGAPCRHRIRHAPSGGPSLFVAPLVSLTILFAMAAPAWGQPTSGGHEFYVTAITPLSSDTYDVKLKNP